METDSSIKRPAALGDTYWLTRFVLLRWMGFVYLVAFYVAARQLVPLVGADGLTPANLFFQPFVSSPSIRRVRFWRLPQFPVALLVRLLGHDAARRSVDRRRAFVRRAGRLRQRDDDDGALVFLHLHRPRRAGLVRLRLGNPDVGDRLSLHLPLPAARCAALSSARPPPIADHLALSLADRAHHARLGADQAARRLRAGATSPRSIITSRRSRSRIRSAAGSISCRTRFCSSA